MQYTYSGLLWVARGLRRESVRFEKKGDGRQVLTS